MEIQKIRLGRTEVEALTSEGVFVGLGEIRIGERVVRGRHLPMTPYFESYSGLQLARLQFCGIEGEGEKAIIRLEAELTRKPILVMRDHSFDPVHDLTDWGTETVAGSGQLRLVLQATRETLAGYDFDGFSYRYEYDAADDKSSLYWIMDRASWELDGDIVGATAISQSACSPPEATFGADTGWSTEGVLHFETGFGQDVNKIMTHNLPRFASHGSFDFQYKGNSTLLGVFEKVGLIRSVLVRDPGKPCLKTFDKHIFDQERRVATVTKRILLNSSSKSAIGQKNLWTWLMDIVHDRARGEFGLQEEPLLTGIAHTYWVNFTADTMYRDLLPAAATLGCDSVFAGDNLKKSDQSELTFTKNICLGQEFEISERYGGKPAVKELIRRFSEAGLVFFNWTNNDQSYDSPLNKAIGGDWTRAMEWFVKMEDARLKYGGSYMNSMDVLDLKKEAPRRYWIDCHKRIKEETGLGHYLFDSFYNLAFMPVSYDKLHPTTMWRELVSAMKELQDAGVHFLIESFGPFGAVQHGCHTSYANPGNEYASYKTHPCCGYCTIPADTKITEIDLGDQLYRLLGHMSVPLLPLYYNGVRVDQTPSAEGLKRAFRDYRQGRPIMHKRFLQEDGKGVIWHDKEGRRAVLWNFADRNVALPGSVQDVSAGSAMPRATTYKLQKNRLYLMENASLPTTI